MQVSKVFVRYSLDLVVTRKTWEMGVAKKTVRPVVPGSPLTGDSIRACVTYLGKRYLAISHQSGGKVEMREL